MSGDWVRNDASNTVFQPVPVASVSNIGFSPLMMGRECKAVVSR